MDLNATYEEAHILGLSKEIKEVGIPAMEGVAKFLDDLHIKIVEAEPNSEIENMLIDMQDAVLNERFIIRMKELIEKNDADLYELDI